MSKKKMMLYIILAFIGGSIITSVVVMVFLQRENYKKGDEILLEYGDSFLDMPLLDKDKRTVDVESFNQDYTFVYYLDKNCSTCVESMPTIKSICDVYEEMNVANMIIWAGEMGDKYTQKNGISIETNYTLENSYINTSTPTFYILNKEMKIIFCGKSMDDMIKKISSLDISSIDMVNENYIKSLSDNQSQDNRPIMVYFSMIGCPDCELVNSIVHNSKIQEVFQVLTFYRDKENVPTEKKDQVDNGGLLAEIYGIDWYPSFLILHASGEYELICEMNQEELEEKLLNYIY